jgi:hypothetical protein
VTEENPNPELDVVRRLLADARHTGPMPDDVATRMDAVLADLARTPADGRVAADPQVASLAVHRRRRAAGLLVAAAAIIVGGVAVAQQLPHEGASSSPTAGGASETPHAAAGDTGNGHEATPPRNYTPSALGSVQLRQGRVVVHPLSFGTDALAGRALMQSKTAHAARADAAGTSCVHAPTDSRLLKAVFRRAPAVLVYHRPAGSTQVVDLFVCGSTQPLRSVTLPRS